jgi:hypothetical protein
MKDHYTIPFLASVVIYGTFVYMYFEDIFSNQLFQFDIYIYTTPPMFVVHLVLLRFLIPYFTEMDLLKIVNRIYLIIYIIFILNLYLLVPEFNPRNDSIHTSLYLISHILWLVPMIGWIMTNKLKTLKDE